MCFYGRLKLITGGRSPMLEQRDARLEQILERLDPKITEILLTGAKQTGIQKLQVELAEARGRVSMLPYLVDANCCDRGHVEHRRRDRIHALREANP